MKWLCGGPGAAYLYVRPDLARTLAPKFTGWLAHENPFAFETGATRYTHGAYRFINGTPNIPALYAALPGLKILRELAMLQVRGRGQRLTAGRTTGRATRLARQRAAQPGAPRRHRRGEYAQGKGSVRRVAQSATFWLTGGRAAA